MRLGRPIPELILNAEEQENTGTLGTPPQLGAGLGPAGSRDFGLCGGQNQHTSERGNGFEQTGSG